MSSAKGYSGVQTPCYAVEKRTAERNATAMHARAASHGCTLRPHVKTHKTLELALLQTGGRRSGIVVSTLAEAEFFSEHGFDDIVYAVGLTPQKVPRAASLTNSMDRFHVVVDSAQQLANLEAQHSLLSGGKRWSVVVMVDSGYHRDGLDPASPASLELARRIAAGPATALAGLYTHGGDSYDARGVADVQKYAAAERDAVAGFAKRLRAAGVEVPTVGVGSTPTCSHPPADGLEGVTEMHPGNYIVYDAMQAASGVCSIDDVAVRVLTRIIGVYPERRTILVDLGWTGVSAQGAADHYGVVTSHPELQVRKLKQEAGEVEARPGVEVDFGAYSVGDVLELAPWHACAAAVLHKEVLVREDGVFTGERWTPCRGW